MNEIWKDIESYEGLYQVSNLGLVRNARGKILKQQLERYLSVTLYKNGPQMFRVHRLVAQAFLGPCPEGMEVNHIDGDKTNNTDSNLEYVTRQDNVIHCARVLGRIFGVMGSRNHKSKLKEDDVREIRALWQTGKYTQQEIADIYMVNSRTISGAITGAAWKWLDPENVKPNTKENGAAKITREDARQIRKLYATGKYLQKDIASMYKVSVSEVSAIITRKHWDGRVE